MVRLMFRLPQKSTLSDDLALLSFVYNQYCLYYFIILLSVILRMKIRTCNWATIDHSFISTTQIPAEPSVTCLCCWGKISVHVIDLLLETWKDTRSKCQDLVTSMKLLSSENRSWPLLPFLPLFSISSASSNTSSFIARVRKLLLLIMSVAKNKISKQNNHLHKVTNQRREIAFS